jgi:acyl carrier protein
MDEKMTAPVTADEIQTMLIAELAAILRLKKDEIETSRPFDEYGLDSTDSLVVVGLVEERLGMELEPELLLRNRCIDEVLQSLKESGRIA